LKVDLSGWANGAVRRASLSSVHEDPMDPGLEAIGVPELGQPAPGEHERVLQNVLGESRVAQDPVGNGVERIADLMHQDCECLSIAMPSPLDEVSIHIDLRSSRPK
jgi:hypothetical protein